MKKAGIEPPLPPVSAPWLLTVLLEIGLFEVAGMDRVPLSWREIGAWQRESGTTLRPWERLLMRRLSSEYLAESRRAVKMDCPAPWSEEPTEDHRQAVGRRIADVLGRG